MDTETNEVTIKYLYQEGRKWFLYLLSKWLWFGLVGCLVGGLSLLYAMSQKPNYTARLNFILANSSSGDGFSGLASQFGIDLSSNSDAFSSDNIISLMTSKVMIQKVLFVKPPGSKSTLLNLYAEKSKLDESWNQNPRTKGSYPFPDNPEQLSSVQDSLLRVVYNDVVNGYLVVSRPDKGLAVYVVETKSDNELFSMYMTKYLVAETAQFYIDTKTSVAKSNLNMLQHEADSIRRVLSSSIVATARVYDQTYMLNPAYQTQRAPAQEGQLNVTAVGSAYGEVLRNLEIAKINLQKEMPLFQIIDEPHLPLVAEKPGKTLALAGGFIAGCVLLAIFFVIRKLLRKPAITN